MLFIIMAIFGFAGGYRQDSPAGVVSVALALTAIQLLVAHTVPSDIRITAVDIALNIVVKLFIAFLAWKLGAFVARKMGRHKPET